MADRIYQMAVSLIVTMITARYLGPTNYGIINYIAAFVTFAIPLCNLGLEGIVVKRIVDSPENEGQHYWNFHGYGSNHVNNSFNCDCSDCICK